MLECRWGYANISAVRRVVQCNFSFYLSFVLKPYSDRFDIPIELALSIKVGGHKRIGVTYIAALCATSSRSSRVGCDVLWNTCSSRINCPWVKRLRVRFDFVGVAVLEVDSAAEVEDDMDD